MSLLDRSERLRLIEVAASVVVDQEDVIPFAEQLEHYVSHGSRPKAQTDAGDTHFYKSGATVGQIKN